MQRRLGCSYTGLGRAAVYAKTEEEQKEANLRTLGKSLSKQSLAIIPKIRELDEFLNSHPEYKGKILESHPEVAFARLNGSVVLSKKKEQPDPDEKGLLMQLTDPIKRI